MSTRSGKRIHSALFDNTEPVDFEVSNTTEKKTRNKRLKENDEQPDFTLPKSKKKKHYVGYPTDDEGGYTTAVEAAEGSISTRKLKKKETLKELDVNVPDTENVTTVEDKKASRVTRQTRKFAENVEDASSQIVKEQPNGKVKRKKNKKKSTSDIVENPPEPAQKAVETKVVTKMSKKKKKGKHVTEKQTTNKSDNSSDSFHSAAGSPLTVNEDEKMSQISPQPEKIFTVFENDNAEPAINNTFEKDSENNRKSILKSVTPVKDDIEPETNNDLKKKRKSSLKPKTPEHSIELSINNVLESESKKKRKSSLKPMPEDVSSTSEDLNSTYDKIDIETNVDKPKTPIQKELKTRRSLRLNSSIAESADNNENVDKSAKLNTTFEKETKGKQTIQSKNATTNEDDISNALNTTFERASNESQNTVISLNSTFNESAPKLNTTFDKNEPKINSGKSSLIRSDDGTINVTFDKEDNSRISITSDESKTEDIVNTTPVLIESSIDESQLSSKLSLDTSKGRDTKSITPQKDTLPQPITPLKREGTFTKESPEVIKTPNKRQTLPSPGKTPFHVTKSPQEILLNVTHSIEKPQSSLVDVVPARQTRVMFCSPVNNPEFAMQQRKTIIKSSLKGSNKSFILDDASTSRPAARKRSYTHNDAEDVGAKRKRLSDGMQSSVDRLSQPRTPYKTAKLPETTPTKKLPTPLKAKSEPKRTKLPNFAALHQKQFDKMESLDECQRRKRNRAKKLMMPKTPNGLITVLERSSPKEPVEQKDTAAKKDTHLKKAETPPKKSETPANKAEMSSKLSNLPTLESLRPGVTRFGFKMSTEFNPFSIPSKSETKTKIPVKSNGMTAKSLAPKPLATVKPLGARQPTLPSLAGTTTTRKEAAKLTVMREKSFTSLSGKRDVKRNECRTIIKGVRTNRRFELQMRMRNLD